MLVVHSNLSIIAFSMVVVNTIEVISGGAATVGGRGNEHGGS